MAVDPRDTAANTIVRLCLLLATAITLGGGLQQLAQGGPADADNVHRFMAGAYIGWAPLFFWAAATIRRQGMLVYFLAVPIFLGGVGRLVSFSQYDIPSPAEFLLASALLDFLLAIVIVGAHSTALRARRAPAAA
ncbi:putative secreted protein [Streptomyces davaonensis JCM 4913]|uniref:Putative secreted protein n=1 Tax=Streptomyces davaonensis (strain DSM 101723 / JCM 4913 / KCC S-0913 / 768) TaxID=1214101 RepID=K4QVA6_STRDJ|nr:DUF4345 family protein [Streptomyces davaonensis]CCK24837.1 putative secreted protein [Streptomyces davaonensis JCM 4913]